MYTQDKKIYKVMWVYYAFCETRLHNPLVM